MRVSVTDRCNLRCTYCMPSVYQPVQHGNILTYEEILRLCRIAVTAGIVKFKVTGGEPLVRKGCTNFISRLKALSGVEQVTLTTNGLLLAGHLDALCAAGVDGINISLDTMSNPEYSEITGYPGNAVETVKKTLKKCIARGLKIKINAVLLSQTFEGISAVAFLAQHMPMDVRFIELMPFFRKGIVPKGVPIEAAIERLRKIWPDLHPINEKRGNGPAQYYAASGLQGRIGFIAAMSHRFCTACNRIRLTSTGMLRPCLFYGKEKDIKTFLRAGCSNEELYRIMRECIEKKPPARIPSSLKNITEPMGMYRIGG